MSPLELLDARTKIFTVVSVSLFSIALDRVFPLILLFTFSILFFALSKPSTRVVKGAAFVVLTVTWGVAVGQGMFYAQFPRTVLFTLIPPFKLLGREFSGLHIYLQGIEYGLVQSLRFSSCTLAGLGLCLSTTPDAMFRAMTSLGVPRTISFVSMVAIRFIPEVAGEINATREAMRIKGYKPFRRGFFYTVKTEIRSLFPVFARAVIRAHRVSSSLIVRGFDPLKEPPKGKAPWRRWEKMASFLFLSISLSCCILKLLYFLYEVGIFYSSHLRILYFLSKEVL